MNLDNLNGGFFLVFHSLFEHPLWRDAPKDYGRIFLELLHHANWKDRKTAAGLLVPRGSLLIGEEKFAQTCRTSREVLQGALRYYTKYKCISRTRIFAPRPGTLITICNYETYQTNGTADTQADTQANTQATPRLHPGDTLAPPIREAYEACVNQGEHSPSPPPSSSSSSSARARTMKRESPAPAQQQHTNTHTDPERLATIRRWCLRVAEEAGSLIAGEPDDKTCREINVAFDGDGNRLKAFFEGKIDQSQAPDSSWWWFVTCAREEATQSAPPPPAPNAGNVDALVRETQLLVRNFRGKEQTPHAPWTRELLRKCGGTIAGVESYLNEEPEQNRMILMSVLLRDAHPPKEQP